MRFYTGQHQYYCGIDLSQRDPFGTYQKYVRLHPRSSRKYSAAQKLSRETTSLIASYRTLPARYRHHGGMHVHLVPVRAGQAGSPISAAAGTFRLYWVMHCT